MTESTHKSSKLLLTSLCNPSWYQETQHSIEADRGLSPRLRSPQPVWPSVLEHHPKRSGRSPYINLAAPPILTAIMEHTGRAQMHPVEKEGFFFFFPICRQSLLKAQATSTARFHISRPSLMGLSAISSSSEHGGHFPALNSIMRASG